MTPALRFRLAPLVVAAGLAAAGAVHADPRDPIGAMNDIRFGNPAPGTGTGTPRSGSPAPTGVRTQAAPSGGRPHGPTGTIKGRTPGTVYRQPTVVRPSTAVSSGNPELDAIERELELIRASGGADPRYVAGLERMREQILRTGSLTPRPADPGGGMLGTGNGPVGALPVRPPPVFEGGPGVTVGTLTGTPASPGTPGSPTRLTAPELMAALRAAREGVARHPDQLHPPAAHQDPTRAPEAVALGAAIDLVLDIEDPELRARIHDMLLVAMVNPALDQPLAGLLAEIARVGPGRVSLTQPGVVAGLQAIYQARASNPMLLTSVQYSQSIDQLLRGGNGVQRFRGLVSAEDHRRGVSAMLDAIAGRSRPPRPAPAEASRAMAAYLRFHYALAAAQTQGWTVEVRNRITRTWNEHVTTMEAYLAASGLDGSTGPSPASPSSPGQGPGPGGPGSPSPVGPGAPSGGVLGQGQGTGSWTGSPGTASPGTPAGPPTTRIPGEAEVEDLRAALRRHRAEVANRLDPVVAVFRGPHWKDSNWEWIQPWTWGTDQPAERGLEEIKQIAFHPDPRVQPRRNLVATIDELARIERALADRRWVFPRSSGFGAELVAARREACGLLVTAHRFHRGEFSRLDEVHDPEAALREVMIEAPAGRRPTMRFEDVRLKVQEGLEDDLRDDCRLTRRDLEAACASAARWFATWPNTPALERENLRLHRDRLDRCEPRSNVFDSGSLLVLLLKHELRRAMESLDGSQAYRVMVIGEPLLP